jgi:hypothetical protein
MRPQEIGVAERTEGIAWRHVWLKSVLVRWELPMTIRRHSDFEDRQLMLFGTATIVLLVIAWTFAYLASRAV